jgi:hypothetical protein
MAVTCGGCRHPGSGSADKLVVGSGITHVIQDWTNEVNSGRGGKASRLTALRGALPQGIG